MTKLTTQDELLKNAQFYPIFGPDGTIEGISQLTVSTDRRLGLRAVEELFREKEEHDDLVMPNGWTVKQSRILRSPAPHAAHYLKPSKKYDAATGEMVPSMTILLPYEVVWRLFELLFEGQYSVEVNNIVTETEDILPPAGPTVVQGDSVMKDDAPGRIFYTRAEVTITLHLANGQQKRYTGVGIAYDHVRLHKTGNVYAITSSRRTAEKGAVSDAKREAISTIGRVFRRAFEDGDEMVQKFQELLLQTLRENNKPAKAARASEAASTKTPAPRRASAVEAPGKPANQTADKAAAQDAPAVKAESVAQQSGKSARGEQQKAPAKKNEPERPYILQTSPDSSEEIEDADAYFDKLSDILSNCEVTETVRSILDANMDEIRRAESHAKSGMTAQSLREMALGSVEEIESEIPDSEPEAVKASAKADNSDEADEDDEAASNGWRFDLPKPTGEAILDAYAKAFQQAKSHKDIDAIIDANAPLAKRLTKTQKGKLLTAISKAKAKS